MSSTTEHVNNSFNSRTETARELLAAAAEDYSAAEEVREQAQEELDLLPLSVERKTLVTITLGTGGPGDWIDAVCSTFEGALGIESATYTAVWGSDRKVTQLQHTDALWQLAEHYIEGMEA